MTAAAPVGWDRPTPLARLLAATATNGTFGSRLKFTADGAYAQLAVDKAGMSGVIWERSSLDSVIQARFGS
jgi:hypothetical protein